MDCGVAILIRRGIFLLVLRGIHLCSPYARWARGLPLEVIRVVWVCMYLRKSRADLVGEARGEGATLSRHKKILLDLAKQKGLNIIKIRQEIASGESLIHRPEMMELLKEVEAGLYDAVLCMDLDRLGRGNMREQGIIMETFQRSGTKIIT